MRRLAVPVLFVILLATTGGAQAVPTPANDSLFRRARRLVSEGNGVVGRAMVDSLLRLEEEGSVGYGNALYWRGALAETAAEAERDYRRVIVEYPLSLYAADALLAIAELEQARGDRAAALLHLQRFVREHPPGTARGVAALAAARLAFEQRDTRTGCALIGDARASASPADVELRNQVEYFGTRCSAAEALASLRDTIVAPAAGAKRVATNTRKAATPAVKPPTPRAAAPPAIATADSGKAATPPVAALDTTTALPEKIAPVAANARGIYTIQLAAYNTRVEAQRLVAKFARSGVTARISGSGKPFRVRLAFYPTRQAALDEIAALRQRGIVGFVTTEDPAAGAKIP